MQLVEFLHSIAVGLGKQPCDRPRRWRARGRPRASSSTSCSSDRYPRGPDRGGWTRDCRTNDRPRCSCWTSSGDTDFCASSEAGCSSFCRCARIAWSALDRSRPMAAWLVFAAVARSARQLSGTDDHAGRHGAGDEEQRECDGLNLIQIMVCNTPSTNEATGNGHGRQRDE